MKTYALVGGLFVLLISITASVYFFTSSNSLKSTVNPPAIQPTKTILGESVQNNTELINKINYWKKVVASHPNYRDGYMQLASLTYEMNNLVAAIDYVNKALELDPNYQPAKELKNILSSGN